MLNVDKMTMMLFGKRKTNCKIKITINGVTVPQVQSTKFLGVWLDDQLSWSTHVGTIRKKLQNTLGLLKRSKHFLNSHCLRILYFAQFQSVMSYGIVVWGPMLKDSDLNMLSKLQNNCMRCISKLQDIDELYKSVHVLPVKKIIMLEQAKLGYKLCNNMLPRKLSCTMLTDQNNASIQKTHGYDTRQKKIPNLAPANSTKYRKSFLYKTISSYSSLPSELTQTNNLPRFISECKKYLHAK